jgi:hypothetical protein
MLLNFSILKGFPILPGLTWENNTGEPWKASVRMATLSHIGDVMTNTIMLTEKSTILLDILCYYFELRQDTTGKESS